MSEAIQQRKFPWLRYWIALLVIALLALWPLLSVLLTYTIADYAGCSVNEGMPQPCMIGDTNWGGTLYTMGVMGWLMIGTIPLGFCAVLIWALALLTNYLSWRKRKAL
ncbi:hypothetical protein WH87_02970 [Devosia epidermidihirudinis]|uniref:Vitamin K epoxide reductase domain-containing protein n=1 Tax=Devosia epidermidihirudinis TaxID=1293439 RepID=A0A0F5QJ50_9HYPH|nr:hypothetical protein [Devosia epidermidihirudinis]KKC40718.1 hypothetical protein WH87_02970 [Devosia epidermidihirudinis]